MAKHASLIGGPNGFEIRGTYTDGARQHFKKWAKDLGNNVSIYT